MRYIVLGLSILLVLGNSINAQTVNSETTSKVSNQTSVNKNGNNVVLESGTQITAQLQKSIDVQKAKVGDQVVLKTTKAIKQNGKVMVEKGANLYGRVTEVQRRTKENGASKVGILFDRLEQRGTSSPLNAAITSIMQTRAQASADDMMNSDMSASSSSRTSTQSSGGGLLGGVGNTVGNVVNTTTQTVGSTTNTVGSATNSVGGTLRGLQISQSSETSASGSSVISLQSRDLKLDKGVTFNLSVSESIAINR